MWIACAGSPPKTGAYLTRAELLAQAEELAKNPPPEVTVDELGEYGRKLVADGVSPAVARYLESLPTLDRSPKGHNETLRVWGTAQASG